MMNLNQKNLKEDFKDLEKSLKEGDAGWYLLKTRGWESLPDGDVDVKIPKDSGVKTLKGLKYCTGNIICFSSSLTTLEGSPASCKSFEIRGAKSLKSLEGGPLCVKGGLSSETSIGDDYYCLYRISQYDIVSGKESFIGGDYVICNCGIVNAIGVPKYIGGHFYLSDNSKLITLLGASDTIVCGSVVVNNTGIRNLQGLPKKIKKGLDCSDNSNFSSFEGSSNAIIGGSLVCRNTKIRSTLGFPKIKRSVDLCNNEQLVSINNCTVGVEKDLNVSNTSINSFEGLIIVDNNGEPIDNNMERKLGQLFVENCSNLTSFKGCAYDVKNLYFGKNESLTSFTDFPNVVGFLYVNEKKNNFPNFSLKNMKSMESKIALGEGKIKIFSSDD